MNTGLGNGGSNSTPNIALKEILVISIFRKLMVKMDHSDNIVIYHMKASD